MEKLEQLEAYLGEQYKKAPSLPVGVRTWIKTNLHWIVLVSGGFQLLSTFWLFDLSRKYNNVADSFNRLTNAFGVASPVEKLNMFYWLSLLVLAVSAVLFLMAYAPVKKRQIKGWRLLFLGTVLNVAYGVVSLVDNSSRGGFGTLLGTVIGALISFYFLYQVKDHFGTHGKHTPEHKPAE